MFNRVKFGVGGLTLLAMMIGCGGAQSGDTKKESVSPTHQQLRPELFACATDSDCVAVERAGCCPDGTLEAVNTTKLNAYQTSFICVDQILCPQHILIDTRVAQCNFAKQQCEMIAPDQISCGGFVAPAKQHNCPAGFQCALATIPDLPGTCKPAAAPTSCEAAGGRCLPGARLCDGPNVDSTTACDQSYGVATCCA
jgi:hypothetical protein